jgi:superfamily II DNA/RNA helicase
MNTFQEMPLPEQLKSALVKLDFVEPTPVQKAVLPIAMEGKDIMACAETGSGKTAAYGIPMVCRLLENEIASGLILAPTRELAHQISEFLRELTADCERFLVTSIVGGADIRKQLKQLKRRPRIVVGTPGRLIDHLKRRSLDLENTEYLVLDEGDRMLDMGFAPQLDQILKYLPKERQTSLFSATIPEKVKKLAAKYLNQPVPINIGQVSQPVAAIKQSVVQVTFRQKDERIVDELNKRTGSVIIFARTQNRTDILYKNLVSYGFEVDLIHGGRSQGQRNRAIQNFREGRSRILCATDIAARGIDVPQVEHVINFDLPMMEEDYVHRIGRTGRNGAKGEAVSFVTPQEHRSWQALARKYRIPGVELKQMPQEKSSNKESGGRGRSFPEWKGSSARGKSGRSAPNYNGEGKPKNPKGNGRFKRFKSKPKSGSKGGRASSSRA